MSGANIKELAKLLGTNIILEVIGGATFNGVLYSVDADSGLVALRENAIGHQADYNIVNAAHIVNLMIIMFSRTANANAINDDFCDFVCTYVC